MIVIFGVAIALILVNKLVGIHIHSLRCEQAVKEELIIVK